MKLLIVEACSTNFTTGLCKGQIVGWEGFHENTARSSSIPFKLPKCIQNSGGQQRYSTVYKQTICRIRSVWLHFAGEGQTWFESKNENVEQELDFAVLRESWSLS